jgi:hypothetical protein
MGINFGAFAKGFTDVIREDQKETRKDNRIIVSNTLDKYTDNFRTKKDNHEKEDKTIEAAANYVLSYIKDPVLAVQIANQGKTGMDSFKKNLELATETGININDLYSSVKEPSKELASLTNVGEIIKAYRPFKAPSIPMVGGQKGFLTANPNDTIKNALKDVVGTEESNKAPAFLGQVKVKQIPELKSNFTQNLLAINTRESNFLEANGGDASALTGDNLKTYQKFAKDRKKVMDTYESLEKVKAKFDAPTSTYSKASAIKTYQSFVASSIANSKLYKISLGEVVENIESNNRNKYIVGSHSAIQNVAKTYTDSEMSKVLDVQFSNLQNQTKDHIIKARSADANPPSDGVPEHYVIKDVNEQELKDGFTKTRVNNQMKNVPIKPGTVLRVNTNDGIKYVLYTGVGVGYLTGNPQQPRMQ